jgi:hypothetical protein
MESAIQSVTYKRQIEELQKEVKKLKMDNARLVKKNNRLIKKMRIQTPENITTVIAAMNRYIDNLYSYWQRQPCDDYELEIYNDDMNTVDTYTEILDILSLGSTPDEIVTQLDKYIIGQTDAKKSIAMDVRSRWRNILYDRK